jgi:hypothetical protein
MPLGRQHPPRNLHPPPPPPPPLQSVGTDETFHVKTAIRFPFRGGRAVYYCCKRPWHARSSDFDESSPWLAFAVKSWISPFQLIRPSPRIGPIFKNEVLKSSKTLPWSAKHLRCRKFTEPAASIIPAWNYTLLSRLDWKISRDFCIWGIASWVIILTLFPPHSGWSARQRRSLCTRHWLGLPEPLNHGGNWPNGRHVSKFQILNAIQYAFKLMIFYN